MKKTTQLYGFTLMELMVVVIIIAVLAAVAVPMYKHAVLKSRFSTVMPVAKTIADAQESYYLQNGQYASDQEALEVTPANTGNTTVELSGAEENADENYAYVVASRSDVPGAKYIQYQKNSPQFASNIHCEALDADAEATWLCEKGLKGTPVAGGISGEGYTTYILQGSSSDGWFVKECTGDGHQERTCSSGCGKITVEGSCDTSTGEWTYEEDTDESGCPVKPAAKQTSCPEGCGSVSVNAVCNSSGTAWEYEDPNFSSCPTKPATSQTCSANGKSGAQTRSVTCNSAGTAWTSGNWSSCEIPCTGNKPANVTASGTGATGTASCVNGEWTYTWTGGKTFGYANFCNVSGPNYNCAGGRYETAVTGCFVSTNTEYGCMGSSFSGRHARCETGTATGCDGSIFKAGSYCVAKIAGACTNVTYDGGCCWSEGNGSCPAGSPKCDANDHTVVSGTW